MIESIDVYEKQEEMTRLTSYISVSSKRYQYGPMIIWLMGFMMMSATAYGAGGGTDSGPVPSFINIYQIIGDYGGLPSRWISLLSGVFALMLLTWIAYRYQQYVSRCLENQNLEPSGRFRLETIIEAIARAIADLSGDLFGQRMVNHSSMMAALFLFILIINLSGLCPFLPPASGDFSANLGIAITVFFLYNLAGIKAQGGWSYLKHFAGPKVNIPVLGLVLPVLIFAVEMISHGFRPVSLSLRLMGNIFGDHMLVGVFTGVVYWVLPAILLFFGVLVSIVQAFVFSLLSGIYVALAVSSDH